jgi:Flp pilus assembly protein TadG
MLPAMRSERPSPAALRGLARDRRGASVVEFAILLPVFACMLYGLLGYGQYFLFAHSVQQLANDAARATVAGLNTAERQTLAQQTVTTELGSLRELPANRVTTAISETGQSVTVRVRFDADHVPMFRTSLLPMPDPVIERSAVVRMGGIT